MAESGKTKPKSKSIFQKDQPKSWDQCVLEHAKELQEEKKLLAITFSANTREAQILHRLNAALDKYAETSNAENKKEVDAAFALALTINGANQAVGVMAMINAMHAQWTQNPPVLSNLRIMPVSTMTYINGKKYVSTKKQMQEDVQHIKEYAEKSNVKIAVTYSHSYSKTEGKFTGPLQVSIGGGIAKDLSQNNPEYKDNLGKIKTWLEQLHQHKDSSSGKSSSSIPSIPKLCDNPNEPPEIKFYSKYNPLFEDGTKDHKNDIADQIAVFTPRGRRKIQYLKNLFTNPGEKYTVKAVKNGNLQITGQHLSQLKVESFFQWNGEEYKSDENGFFPRKPEVNDVAELLENVKLHYETQDKGTKKNPILPTSRLIAVLNHEKNQQLIKKLKEKFPPNSSIDNDVEYFFQLRESFVTKFTTPLVYKPNADLEQSDEQGLLPTATFIDVSMPAIAGQGYTDGIEYERFFPDGTVDTGKLKDAYIKRISMAVSALDGKKELFLLEPKAFFANLDESKIKDARQCLKDALVDVASKNAEVKINFQCISPEMDEMLQKTSPFPGNLSLFSGDATEAAQKNDGVFTAMGNPVRPEGNGALGHGANSAGEENIARKAFGLWCTNRHCNIRKLLKENRTRLAKSVTSKVPTSKVPTSKPKAPLKAAAAAPAPPTTKPASVKLSIGTPPAPEPEPVAVSLKPSEPAEPPSNPASPVKPIEGSIEAPNTLPQPSTSQPPTEISSELQISDPEFLLLADRINAGAQKARAKEFLEQPKLAPGTPLNINQQIQALKSRKEQKQGSLKKIEAVQNGTSSVTLKEGEQKLCSLSRNTNGTLKAAIPGGSDTPEKHVQKALAAVYSLKQQAKKKAGSNYQPGTYYANINGENPKLIIEIMARAWSEGLKVKLSNDSREALKKFTPDGGQTIEELLHEKVKNFGKHQVTIGPSESILIDLSNINNSFVKDTKPVEVKNHVPTTPKP